MPDRIPPDLTAPAPSHARDELTEILHRRRQRATPQRLVILRELRRLARHCTAEEVRRAVRDELPGTSAPTVYATLDLLVELGLVRRVDAGGAAALYDPRVDPHQHVVCRRCGRVDDLEVVLDDGPLIEAARRTGFAPETAGLVISGLCAACAAA
jgi:Fe2+ or Zn2+ uptake regulation protein